jgi:hypothetical protein
MKYLEMKQYFSQKMDITTMTDSEIAEFGCCVCRLYFDEFSPAEVHHLREDTGLALKSNLKIGLCALHHRLGNHGIAFHAGKIEFEKNFGTQIELYEQTIKLWEQNRMVKS